MKKHYRHENDCLNCGTILEGKFCHNCGQENLQMKESFGHMINHAVSDYFHFDYQFFHTLRPLFLKPGHLTNEYVLGHRAQYLHPVKMYIFISLVFFIIFFQGKKQETVNVKENKQSEQKSIDNNTKKSIDNGTNTKSLISAEQKQELSKKIKAFIPDTITKQINADLKKDSEKVKDRKADNKGGFTFYGDDNINKFKSYEEYLADQSKLPADKRDNSLARYMIKKNFDWKKQGKNAKEILSEGLKHNAPKMMFLLLPMFAFILKLAFWNNHKFYVEHIIYTIHLHCYLFLFLTFIMLLNMILPESWGTIVDLLQTLATITIIWYVYRSLRVVYNRSRWRTVSKMVGVSFMYSIVFGISFFIILIITAITSV
jgi:hypothetical protein